MSKKRRLLRRLKIELRRIQPGDVVIVRHPVRLRAESVRKMLNTMGDWIAQNRPGAVVIAVAEGVSIDTLPRSDLLRAIGATEEPPEDPRRADAPKGSPGTGG